MRLNKEIVTSDIFDIGDLLVDEKGNKVAVIGITNNDSEVNRKIYRPVIYSANLSMSGEKLIYNEDFFNSETMNLIFHRVYIIYVGEKANIIGYGPEMFAYLTGKYDLEEYKYTVLSKVYEDIFIGWDLTNSCFVKIFYRKEDKKNNSYHKKGTLTKEILDLLPEMAKEMFNERDEVTEVQDALAFVQFVGNLRFKDKKNTLPALIKAYFLPLFTYSYYEKSGKVLTEAEIIRMVKDDYGSNV